MRPARRGGAWLCAGLLLFSTSAAAQTDHPKRRPQPPPAAQPPETDNVTGGPASLPNLRPAPVAPVLRSAVQSRWSHAPTIGRSTTAQCRTTCAQQRGVCAEGALGGSDTTNCDPGWMQCLSTCDGLTYQRGP